MFRDFSQISRKILNIANLGVSRLDFLQYVSIILIDYFCWEELILVVNDNDFYYLWKILKGSKEDYLFKIIDDNEFSKYREKVKKENKTEKFQYISFTVKEGNCGFLGFKLDCNDEMDKEKIEFISGIAHILGIAVANRRAQSALKERIKELTCLYGISQVVQESDVSIEKIIKEITRIVPESMKYPKKAFCRIILDGKEFSTKGFIKGKEKIFSYINIRSENRGEIEVVYSKRQKELEKNIFLKEEQSLIDTVARQIAFIVENREANKDKEKLQEQLLHADRLTTIGHLAAGVAHELNEPLSNILGFSQLARKCPNLPEQASQDLLKVVNASLNARDIVKKLLIFARQMPTKKIDFFINRLVKEVISFFEGRLKKKGIVLNCYLEKDLPLLNADPGQINQVIVNLIVNSIQAMPNGGKLIIKTGHDINNIILIIEDTGFGMTKDIQEKAFMPFFTTKKIGEGTGLGLSMVDGIISSHGGKIILETEPGKGTRFVILIPV